jgi:Amt family ammonium transporter
MGFGTAWIGTFVGHPGPVIGSFSEQGQAHIPNVSGAGFMPKFHFSQSALVYFQFVFAAITPLLFLGSVVGRISFKVWLLFVPLWSTFAYAVNAFLRTARSTSVVATSSTWRPVCRASWRRR